MSLAVRGGASYGFACAAFAGGSAKCWGYNSASYTLGDGVTSTSQTGVTPTGLDADVKTMVAGYAHARDPQRRRLGRTELLPPVRGDDRR